MPDKNYSIPDSNKKSLSLNRVLGLTTGILMVAGIMIGSGVFKKIAPMSALGLDASYILAAWFVAGLVTLCGALSVSGLAGLTTESGGEYEYIRKVYGPFAAFMFGWACFTIIGSASIAAMGFIFSQSVGSLLPLYEAPPHLAEYKVLGLFKPMDQVGIKVLSVFSIMAITWVNVKGTRKGATLFNYVTYAKITGILFLIVLGLFFAGTSSHQEISESHITSVSPGSYSFISIFFAAMLSAFWAYDGWLNVAFISGEIKNPSKNIPIAMIAGVLLVMGLYMLINLAFLKALPVQQLAALPEKEIAASVMAGSVLGYGGELFISFLILLCTFGALNGMILTYARLYYKMAGDGLFFSKASAVHASHHTPHIALLYSMLMSCLLVFSGSFDQLTDMAIFAGFFFYMLLAIGVIQMKRKGIITKRIPGYPVVPVIFISFSIVLLINTVYTQPRETMFGILLILSGLPLYWHFSKRRKSL